MNDLTKTIQLGKFSSPRKMSDVEAAYWASMIDGEGSITIARATMKDQRRPQFRLVVNVTNTDFSLLQELGELVGVGGLSKNLRPHERWKDRGRLILNHEAAAFVIEQVRPFLRVKGPQAENAIRFIRLKRDWSRANDNYQEQEALYEANRALNARGKVNQKEYTFSPVTLSARGCEREGCGEAHYGNGFCRRHYRWAYESKTGPHATRKCAQCESDLAPTARIDARFCSTACKMKFHRASGCYTPAALADAPKCSEPDCGRPRQAKGLCRRHYMQHWHTTQRDESEKDGVRSRLAVGPRRPAFCLRRMRFQVS